MTTVFVTILTALLILWLSPNWLRVVLLSGLTAVACTVVTLYIVQQQHQPPVAMAMQPVIQADVSPQVVIGGDAKWKWVYAFQRRWEGNKCTVDPVLTFAGTTQAAYDTWRRSKGLPTRHVCRYLTPAEHEAIAYQRYYVASGAINMPAPIALQVHDMSYNAGVGNGKRMYRACGNDFTCMVQWRLNYYRSLRTFSLYGKGWTNRVRDSIQYVQGK